jgi:hypothetical protein
VSAFAVRQRLGIHQLGEDQDLIVLDPDALEPLACRLDASPLHAVEEGIERVGEGEVVITASSVASLGAPSSKVRLPMRGLTSAGVDSD